MPAMAVAPPSYGPRQQLGIGQPRRHRRCGASPDPMMLSVPTVSYPKAEQSSPTLPKTMLLLIRWVATEPGCRAVAAP